MLLNRNWEFSQFSFHWIPAIFWCHWFLMVASLVFERTCRTRTLDSLPNPAKAKANLITRMMLMRLLSTELWTPIRQWPHLSNFKRVCLTRLTSTSTWRVTSLNPWAWKFPFVDLCLLRGFGKPYQLMYRLSTMDSTLGIGVLISGLHVVGDPGYILEKDSKISSDGQICQRNSTSSLKQSVWAIPNMRMYMKQWLADMSTYGMATIGH